MKKFVYFLFIFIVFFQFTQTVKAENFDWINFSQNQRGSTLLDIKNSIFNKNFVTDYSTKTFKIRFESHVKDSDYVTHYNYARNFVKDTTDYNISAFFIKNQTLLYMYAIQYKKDLHTAYYYDAAGRLRYLDLISENYPKYPYFSRQYTVKGEFIGAKYFISKDIVFLFNKKQEFSGVLIKNQLYDEFGKKA